MPSLHFDITGDNSNALKVLNELRKSVKDTMSDVERSGDAIDSALGKITQVASAVGLAFGAKEFAKSVLDVRSNIESLEISFTTMLGSEKKAMTLLKDIKDFAVSTPMQLGDLAKGAQTMLSFGIEAEKILPLLKQIGDVSQGNSGKFNSLVLSFSQATSAGRLMGQDFLQMVGQGFNPLQVIAQKTGKTLGEMKKEMEAGAISAEMLADAYKTVTSEGGQFYNALENQSKSIQGSLSNLQGAWDDLLNDIGTSSQDTFVSLINGTTEVVKSYKDYIGILEALVASYGVYKATLMVCVTAEKTLALVNAESLVVKRASAMANVTMSASETKAIAIKKLLTIETLKLNAALMANPYTLVAVALAVVVGAMVAYAVATKDATKAQRELNEAGKEYADETEKQKKAYQDLEAIVRDETKSEEERNQALAEMKKLNTSHLGNMKKVLDSYDTYKDYVDNATEAQKAFNSELAKTNKLHNISSYEDAKDTLNQLREYKKLVDEYGYQSANKTDTYRNLSQQIKSQIRADGIDSVVNTYYNEANKKAGEARANLNAEWDSKWLTEGIDSKSLEKELNRVQQNIDKATKANKNWVSVGGIPIAVSDLQERITKGNKFLEKQNAQTKKNYDYWEKEKKRLEGELKSLGSNEEGSAQWKELQKKIQEAEKEMNKYSKSKTDAEASKASELAKKKAEYLRTQQEYNQKILRDEIDAELERRQAVLDSQEDGTQKELEQIDLNYDKQKEAIKRWYEDLLKQKIASAKALWEKDPNNSKKVWNDSMANASYTETETAEYIAKNKANEKVKETARKDVLKEEKRSMIDYLKEYGTIEEQRLAIVQDYEQQIAEAKTDWAKKSLKEQKELALQEFDFSAFKDKINWEGVFGNLEFATKTQLDSMKQQIEEYMKSDAFKALDPSQKQSVIEGMNNINDAYSKGSNAFGGYLQSRKDVSEAKTRVETAENAVNTKKFALVNAKNSGNNDEIRKATKELVQAEKERTNAEQNLSNKEIASRQKLIGAMNMVGTNLASLGELSSALGIDPESEAGSVMGHASDAVNNAMGAYTDFMSGNYVGALTKGITAIDSAIAVFDNGNMAAMNAEIERLSNANEGLADVINDLKNTLEEGSVDNAKETYNKAMELLQKQEENSSRIMLDEASKWEHGGHSMAYNFNDSQGNINAVKKAGRILEKNLNSLQDLLSMSAEEWKTLRDEDADLYNNILQGIRDSEGGHTGSGVDEMIQQYISDYADAQKELNDQLKEKLTDTTFSSIEDEFKSTLLDMDSDAEDFAHNFENLMRNAVINAMLSNLYSKKLSAWYDSFSKAMEKDNLSIREYETLQADLSKIYDDALTERDTLMRMLGLDSSSGSQSSTTKGVGQMTQDTAEELNGRFTAIQISNEIINKNITQAIASLTQMSSYIVNGNSILNNILVQSTIINGNLTAIYETQKKKLSEFSDTLSKIETNTRNI